MKGWGVGIITWSLILALSIPVYGQEVKAYATVLIIIPPREEVEEVKKPEPEQEVELEEKIKKTSPQMTEYEYYEVIKTSFPKDVALAKDQREEIKTSE